MKILLPILFISLSACGQNKSTILSDKQPIRIDSVETVYIKKSSIDNDSIKLNYGQTKAFIDKWNNSESIGLYKYLPDYWIILIGKDGSFRKFRTNKDKINEKNDWAFSIGDTSFIESIWKSNTLFSIPEQYDPISFIKAVSRAIKVNEGYFSVGITMVDKFPNDWVKREHIDTLISMIDSKDTCGCFLNPLSSYIPSGCAEKGGYAALFIKSFMDNKPVSFGLYACPKVDKKLNEELISWWINYKNK
ncbi:hypothetical protein Ctha_1016 [Chloroherpeton thalassium ATCC 35110]|uniref:Lipoprotein n=1 Tax=Chloroherpeton thalassium (strain ATCC 35110 / GB-78) TaxID=517418 RepID=B3QXV3_CHLT3|nr:hypothetical protein [Chloroherpeton thalassium]ACF13481.1 hypothetical protein Ctha_1016 [Chloroherpeton thalassium ATCC 35110]